MKYIYAVTALVFGLAGAVQAQDSLTANQKWNVVDNKGGVETSQKDAAVGDIQHLDDALMRKNLARIVAQALESLPPPDTSGQPTFQDVNPYPVNYGYRTGTDTKDPMAGPNDTETAGAMGRDAVIELMLDMLTGQDDSEIRSAYRQHLQDTFQITDTKDNTGTTVTTDVKGPAPGTPLPTDEKSVPGSGEPTFQQDRKPPDQDVNVNFKQLAAVSRELSEQAVPSPSDAPDNTVIDEIRKIASVAGTDSASSSESGRTSANARSATDNNPGNDIALDEKWQQAVDRQTDNPATGTFTGDFWGSFSADDIDVGGALSISGNFAQPLTGEFTGKAVINQGGVGSIDLLGITFQPGGAFENSSVRINGAALGDTDLYPVTDMTIWGQMQDSSQALGDWSMTVDGFGAGAAAGNFDVRKK